MPRKSHAHCARRPQPICDSQSRRAPPLAPTGAARSWPQPRASPPLGAWKNVRLMLKVPIYGIVLGMEMISVNGEPDLLVLLLRISGCRRVLILEWDSCNRELNTRGKLDFPDDDEVFFETSEGKNICTCDPDRRMIGLYFGDIVFKVIPFDHEALLCISNINRFNTTLKFQAVLDLKFLYGCVRPTFAVLYQDLDDRTTSVTAYVVDIEEKSFEMMWSQKTSHGAKLLLPVPSPSGGVLVVGDRRTVSYKSSGIMGLKKRLHRKIPFAGVCERMDMQSYLLGDLDGSLHELRFNHGNNGVEELHFYTLGTTSLVCSISKLRELVFVGSRRANSEINKA